MKDGQLVRVIHSQNSHYGEFATVKKRTAYKLLLEQKSNDGASEFLVERDSVEEVPEVLNLELCFMCGGKRYVGPGVCLNCDGNGAVIKESATK